MLNETYRAMLNNKSVIRETFMYGRQRAAQIGSENVFDYSLGNPSVPCPPEFTEAMQTLLAQEEPVSLHGYCPSQGDPGFRTAVAAHLTETFDLPYAQKHIFPTTGAAGAIAHAIRAVTQPGDEVLTFAPYFPEYGPYVAGTGAVLRVVPPQAPTFQPNLDAFAQMLTEKVTCVLINTPNNPTGAAYTRAQLKAWVDYARKNDAIILYDAAYECFISEGELARSIFEIEGARECAVEICSFSKIAGFTGTRCGYTVVPKELEREGMNLNKLWLRRQTTKFNGVPYVVQRAAAAVFTESGMAEIQSNLDYYRRNAKVIADALDECGVWYCGGKNSPYIWLRCPGGMDSWQFFDWLLENCGVVGTPGVGFGECGEGYFRLTAFGDAEKTKLAAERIKTAIKAL